MNEKLGTYRAVDTLGKSQIDLVIQVYDGAISALSSAKSHYQDDNNNAGYEQIERARRFIVHLYTTLDTENGGEIAENLGKLYAFVIGQTHVIEATKDLAMIDDIITIVKDLRSGWVGIRGQQTKTPTTASEDSQNTGSNKITAMA